MGSTDLPLWPGRNGFVHFWALWDHLTGSHGPSMSYGWLFNQKPGASPEIIGSQQKWIQRLKSSRKTREAMQPSLGFPSWGQQTQPLRPFFHGHNVKHHHCLHEEPLCLETGPTQKKGTRRTGFDGPPGHVPPGLSGLTLRMASLLLVRYHSLLQRNGPWYLRLSIFVRWCRQRMI